MKAIQQPGAVVCVRCACARPHPYSRNPHIRRATCRSSCPIRPAARSTSSRARSPSGSTELWGNNVVVDNRPGASGMIGTEIAVRAEPDGHTLLGHTSSYPATAAVREKLPFDPARAIVPVACSRARRCCSSCIRRCRRKR